MGFYFFLQQVGNDGESQVPRAQIVSGYAADNLQVTHLFI